MNHGQSGKPGQYPGGYPPQQGQYQQQPYPPQGQQPYPPQGQQPPGAWGGHPPQNTQPSPYGHPQTGLPPANPHPLDHSKRSIVSKVQLERQFELNVTIEGIHYVGSFTVVRPNVFTQLLIQSRKGSMLNGYYYDPTNPGWGIPDGVDELADRMCFLLYTITQCPPWYNNQIIGGNVYHMELIDLIYEKAALVDPFRASILNSREPEHGDGGSHSDQEHHRAEPSNALEDLVDEEIPTSDNTPVMGDEPAG